MTDEPHRPPGARTTPKQAGLRGPHFKSTAPAAPVEQTAPATSEAELAFSSPPITDEWRELDRAHSAAARDIAVGLASLLRTPVEVSLAELVIAPCSKHFARVQSPTCLVLARAEPLSGVWLLEINLALAFPLIDRLLGGSGDAGSIQRRGLTEIESRLIGRIASLFFKQLECARRPAQEIKLTQERIESSIASVSLTKENAEYVLAPFEIAFCGQRGRLNLYLPVEAARRLAGTPAIRLATTDDEANPSGGDPTRLVEVVAYMAETKISAAELAQLEVGDLITTDTPLEGPVLLYIDGTKRFLAQPGAADGHRAVKITRPVSDDR